jgi:hypothetical protein
MVLRTFTALVVASSGLFLFAACGKKEPQAPPGSGGGTATVATAAPPECKEAPLDPTAVIAKEPALLNACLANAGKVDANLCGSAKIALKVGKNGRVQNAEVAQSTLPVAVTDCVKARLSALQYACPSDDSAVYTVPVGLPIGGPAGECPGMPATPAPIESK